MRTRSEEQFQALITAQQRTETQVAALVEAQQRTEARLTTLVEPQQRLETRMATLIDDVGELKRDNLEARYRTRSQQYFRRLVRRPHVLTADEFTALLDDARDQGRLSEAETNDLAAWDIIVQGRHQTERTEMYLAVEISWGVGTRDVERAVRRAAYLTRIGLTTVPVVAGKWITPEALQLAQHMQVQHLTERRFAPLDDPNTPEANPGESGSASQSL